MKNMKNKIFRTVLMFCALFSILASGTAYPQERQISTVTVRGQVITDDAQPVQGVVVKAFNTSKVAFTDAQGNFSVAVTSGQTDRLSVSLDGYFTRIVTVEPGSIELSAVTLENKISISGSNIEDLPYRSLTSDRNVSAVSTITGDELVSYPTATLLDALARKDTRTCDCAQFFHPGSGILYGIPERCGCKHLYRRCYERHYRSVSR